MTQGERIRAVIDCGFTERQARFLVLVMRHAGVCIPRQYAGFAATSTLTSSRKATAGAYASGPSTSRSTSSTFRMGAPGRRGNTGTPRSNRTSASAIRRSRVSTNSSTSWPAWRAKLARRALRVASTVIVVVGGIGDDCSGSQAIVSLLPADVPRIAPVEYSAGALGRIKGSLRRCAPLTRPSRSL